MRDLDQAKGRDRIGLALEDQGSDRLAPDIALRQPVGRFAQQNSPRLGCLLQPSGEIGGIADNRVIHWQPVSDRAEHH